MNSGRDKNALAIAGGGPNVGESNTATGVTATSLTRSGASWTTDQWKGFVVLTTSGTSAYGVIMSNTATALTIDRWYNPASPTGAAVGPPTAGAYIILGWAAPAWYTAISESVTALAGTDTSLAGEITTAGGGLIRKASTYAHTAGAQTYTLTTTYTANGSDVLPKVISKMATFDAATVGGVMFHETLVIPTATLSASGDQLTLTQTVTLS